MPQATLTFRLPEEQSEHRNAVDADKAFSLIQHINRRIREREKYGQGDAESDLGILLELRSEIYQDFPDIDER